MVSSQRVRCTTSHMHNQCRETYSNPHHMHIIYHVKMHTHTHTHTHARTHSLYCIVLDRVGRVTGRLPKELADEVVGSVLELCRPMESDGAWHGGEWCCLCC